jgi:hypothetical protein
MTEDRDDIKRDIERLVRKLGDSWIKVGWSIREPLLTELKKTLRKIQEQEMQELYKKGTCVALSCIVSGGLRASDGDNQ